MKKDAEMIERIGLDNIANRVCDDDYTCNPEQSQKEVAVGIKIRVSTEEQREILYQIEDLFHKLGITFDTGACQLNGALVRDWEFDWSLSGPIRVYFRNLVKDDPKNRHVRQALKEKENTQVIDQ